MALRHTTRYRTMDGEPQLGYTYETDIYTTLDEVYTEIASRCISDGIMPTEIILFDQNEEEINIEVYKYINPTGDKEIFVSNFMTETVYIVIEVMVIEEDEQEAKKIYAVLTEDFTSRQLQESINI